MPINHFDPRKKKDQRARGIDTGDTMRSSLREGEASSRQQLEGRSPKGGRGLGSHGGGRLRRPQIPRGGKKGFCHTSEKYSGGRGVCTEEGP